MNTSAARRLVTSNLTKALKKSSNDHHFIKASKLSSVAGTEMLVSKCPITQLQNKINSLKSRLSSILTDFDSTKVTVNGVRSYEEIPQPKSLPFLGSVLDYTVFGKFSPMEFDKALVSRHKKLGSIYREKMMNEEFVYISDPKDVNTLVRNEGEAPIRPHLDAIVEGRKQENLPVGITALQGKEWLQQRKAAMPALSQLKSVRSYRESQEEASKDFIKFMEKSRDKSTGQIQDFEFCLNKWALESVAIALIDTRLGLFSNESNEQKRAAEKLHKCMDIFFEYGARLTFGIPLWKLWNTKDWKIFCKAQQDEFKYAGDIVDKKLNMLEEAQRKCPFHQQTSMKSKKSAPASCLLDHIVKNKSLSRNDSLTLCLELLAGGIDTTSTCAIFTMFQLSKNQKYQQHLRQLLQNGNNAEFAKWLKACSTEAMRLNPLTYANARKTEKDLVLSGYDVPKGTVVRFTSHLVNLKDEKYFPQPLQFRPERWVDRNSPLKCKQQFVFTPFGHGARQCPGRKIAEQELELLFKEILTKYHISYKYEDIGTKVRLFNKADKEPKFSFTPI